MVFAVPTVDYFASRFGTQHMILKTRRYEGWIVTVFCICILLVWSHAHKSQQSPVSLDTSIKAITLVLIDDRTIEAIGTWPWPPTIHARAISVISEFKPRERFYNIHFSVSRWTTEENDEILRRLRSSHVPLVMPSQSKGFLPEYGGPLFFGVSSAVLGADGTARFVSAFEQSLGHTTYSGLLASLSLGVPVLQLPRNALRIEKPHATFSTVSFVDLLSIDSARTGRLLSGQIVMVGLSCASMSNHILVPWGAVNEVEFEGLALATVLGDFPRVR